MCGRSDLREYFAHEEISRLSSEFVKCINVVLLNGYLFSLSHSLSLSLSHSFSLKRSLHIDPSSTPNIITLLLSALTLRPLRLHNLTKTLYHHFQILFHFIAIGWVIHTRGCWVISILSPPNISLPFSPIHGQSIKIRNEST